MLELGFEELPPDQVHSYSAQLAELVTALLGEHRLSHRGVRTYGSPRRMIAAVAELAPRRSDRVVRVRGPRRAAYFGEDGSPTKAAMGFARKHGVGIPQLTEEVDGDVAYVAVTIEEPGRSASEVLAHELPGVLSSLSAGRAMRWSAGHGYVASRPLRRIVALLGDAVVPFSYGDVCSGRETRALRSSDHPHVCVPSADNHLAALEASGVEYDGAARRARILAGAQSLAASVGGSVSTDVDGGVLDEVTNLVENPQPLMGAFEDEYLRLPSEVLTVVMKAPALPPGAWIDW